MRVCHWSLGVCRRLKAAEHAVKTCRRQLGCSSRSLDAAQPLAYDKIPKKFTNENEQLRGADVIVCGGGLVGTSVAYHLAKAGKSVVLLEQTRIGCGTAWLSCGFFSVHHLWCEPATQNLAQITYKLYQKLARQYPEIGYRQCSRLYLATEHETVLALRRMASIAVAQGAQIRLLKPGEVTDLFPHVRVMDISLGLLVLDEAMVNTYALCCAIASEAISHGLTIMEGCEIENVCVNDAGQVYGVDTDLGFLECRSFVDASGQVYGSLPLKGFSEPSLHLPVQACTYSYLVTKPIPDAAETQPIVVHDLDKQVYLGQRADNSLVCGGFVPESVTPTEPLPKDFNFNEAPADWDLFYPALETLVSRFPVLAKAKHDRLITASESYTPDGQPILGQVPQLDRYWIAGGMCGHGIGLAAGAGSLLADWIIGKLKQDISSLDVQRFIDLHCNPHYLKLRAAEIAGQSYKPTYHQHQCRSARNLRKSPIHQQLQEQGAVFHEIQGFERPLYFVANQDERVTSMAYGQDILEGCPVWFEHVFSEYEACRERVAVIDMSSYAKFDVIGEDESVVDFLNYLCSADVDKPIGQTVYTGMQNSAGGYVTDCTVSRIGPHHYFIVAPTAQQVRCRVWMEKHLAKNSRIAIRDQTSMFTAFNVLGPSSRYLMEELTNESMSPARFPSFRCKLLNVGFASGVRAISVSHCGELGWVLYTPNEFAQHVYEKLVDAGALYSLRHCGYYALRHLRMEKFYVYWGTDIGWCTTPFECGREFRVDFNKPDFIGKEALLQQKEKGVTRRHVQLLVQQHNLHTDPWPVGREPIYRDGVYCGMTTSASYGYTLGTQVCLGYIDNLKSDGSRDVVSSSFITKEGVEYEMDIAGKRFPLRVNLHSPILPMVSSEHPVHFRPTQ